MATARNKLIKLPTEYFDSMVYGEKVFAPLYQLENGLRIIVDRHLSACYGADWWNVSLRVKLPNTHDYAATIVAKMARMPYIGDSTSVAVKPIHLITLGQLEEILRTYKSDCIPELFPTIEFFVGHMEIIKRVRNLFSHMFPCMSSNDVARVKREIKTLSEHINEKIP
jgi:hypothetical protein